MYVINPKLPETDPYWEIIFIDEPETDNSIASVYSLYCVWRLFWFFVWMKRIKKWEFSLRKLTPKNLSKTNEKLLKKAYFYLKIRIIIFFIVFEWILWSLLEEDYLIFERSVYLEWRAICLWEHQFHCGRFASLSATLRDYYFNWYRHRVRHRSGMACMTRDYYLFGTNYNNSCKNRYWTVQKETPEGWDWLTLTYIVRYYHGFLWRHSKQTQNWRTYMLVYSPEIRRDIEEPIPWYIPVIKKDTQEWI